jgi:hypothetical protein
LPSDVKDRESWCCPGQARRWPSLLQSSAGLPDRCRGRDQLRADQTQVDQASPSRGPSSNRRDNGDGDGITAPTAAYGLRTRAIPDTLENDHPHCV